jgi:hypothetical protein
MYLKQKPERISNVLILLAGDTGIEPAASSV